MIARFMFFYKPGVTSSLMCMNIIFNVSSPLLPQFPSTPSCTKSWSQSLLLIVVPPSIPHCPIAASSSRIFLSISRTEPVLKYCSIAKYTNFPFQRVLICPKLIPNKRVMSILSQRYNLSRRISERATSNVLTISPYTGLQIH